MFDPHESSRLNCFCSASFNPEQNTVSKQLVAITSDMKFNMDVHVEADPSEYCLVRIDL